MNNINFDRIEAFPEQMSGLHPAEVDALRMHNDFLERQCNALLYSCLAERSRNRARGRMDRIVTRMLFRSAAILLWSILLALFVGLAR